MLSRGRFQILGWVVCRFVRRVLRSTNRAGFISDFRERVSVADHNVNGTDSFLRIGESAVRKEFAPNVVDVYSVTLGDVIVFALIGSMCTHRIAIDDRYFVDFYFTGCFCARSMQKCIDYFLNKTCALRVHFY